MPLFLHCRDAGARFADILRRGTEEVQAWQALERARNCIALHQSLQVQSCYKAPASGGLALCLPSSLFPAFCSRASYTRCLGRLIDTALMTADPATCRQHRRGVNGVVHCFTGSRAELEAFLEMGLHIGITGWVADDRPERGGAELAALLPLIPGASAARRQRHPFCAPPRHMCLPQWSAAQYSRPGSGPSVALTPGHRPPYPTTRCPACLQTIDCSSRQTAHTSPLAPLRPASHGRSEMSPRCCRMCSLQWLPHGGSPPSMWQG